MDINIKNRISNPGFIIFSICCLLVVICPFFAVMRDGSSSYNFIYNDGKVADGTLIIPLTVLTYLLSLFGFYKASLIPTLLSSLIFGLLFYNLAYNDYLSYVTFNFYLLYIGFIGIIVSNILLIIFNRKKR